MAALALEKRLNGNGTNGHANGAAGAADNGELRAIMLGVGGVIGAISVLSLGIVWALLKIFPV